MAKSSALNCFASNKATAMASPKAREAVVLVVGAKSRGQASCDIPVSIFIFELLAIVESLDPVI